MGEVDDMMQLCSQKVCESEKYRVMLKRNNSIVKDTMSKLWKLNGIIQTHINHQGSGVSQTQEVINEEFKNEDQDGIEGDEEEPPIELQDVVKMIPDVSLDLKGIKDIPEEKRHQDSDE